MTTTVDQLVSDVLTEGAFDATSAQALRWLDRRHKMMCARARAYRKTVTATYASGLYTVTGLVEALAVQTDGVVYTAGRTVDLPGIRSGTLPISAAGAIYVADDTGFTLYPDPTPDAVSIYGAFTPPDLAAGAAGNAGGANSLRVDDEAVEGLLAGVFATALSRPGESRPDLAAPQEAVFSAACEEFRSRVNRRFRGAGTPQIRIVGVNA